jgi:arabinan endo-1,5-alpha-L-arabinosidase
VTERTHLTSPEQTRYSFSIVIEETKQDVVANDTQIKLEVSLGDITHQYILQSRDHGAYLDLFSSLAHDHGMRLPQNRITRGEETFEASYQEVLTNNLSPKILYGYGDPAVIRITDANGGMDYYLVVTSNDAPDSFPICHSKNLKDWNFKGFVFPEGQKPAWVHDGENSDFWAPEMHQFGGEFRVHFVAREKETLELCIGVARSTNPLGPFVADEAPMLRGNVIDPHVFVESRDTAYLYWKEDNNAVWPRMLISMLYEHPSLITHFFSAQQDQLTASFMITLWPWIQTLSEMEIFMVCQTLIEAVTSNYSFFQQKLREIKGQSIVAEDVIDALSTMITTPVYAQQLSPDGSSLIGEKIKVLENDLPWEAHLIEGMWVTKQNDRYYIFYSGNDFSTDLYGIGVAVADHPCGPFTKPAQPILQSSKEWWAPGHPSVVEGPDGNHYLFLHAYFPKQAGYKQFRALLSLKITFGEATVSIN